MHDFGQVLDHYVNSFVEKSKPFLHYYTIGDNKQLQCRIFTRGDFQDLSYKAAAVLISLGLKPGDHFVNCFGANHYQDLAFRHAAVITGIIPATVNWQADTLERVKYKINSTDAKLILYDSLFDRSILDALKASCHNCKFFDIEELEEHELRENPEFDHEPDHTDTRIVIFTSGTTGTPKGVQLPYSAYKTNHHTFEEMLGIEQEDKLALLVVNPLHHTNSTAITDWGMRRPGAEIHLVQRYNTQYWMLNAKLAKAGYCRVVAPLVAKHFDFLESLHSQDRLPVALDSLTEAMAKIDYLIGSAPVGPTTIKRLLKYAGRVPTVRFGSTETCLQVMGIPASLDEETKMLAFEAGWNHDFEGCNIVGYYIGRPTPPYTECKIVKAIDRDETGYFEECAEGEPGYLVTRGKNLMTGYLNNPSATDEVFHEGEWYSGLKDICFALRNKTDQQLDFYWQGRDSFLLIKGGANYAYDQINAELERYAEDVFGLEKNTFEIAVVGLRINSEHEDDCCVTMQLNKDMPAELKERLQKEFISMATKHISKGSAPDHFRFGDIPKNFKGAVLVPELKKTFKELLQL